ncbi:MAG: FxLYD domain-containing protein [Candidatus Nitrosocosmicus sp.]|nr:FxLYD domain-containing protein [Candidatus Nitrosocosmicus sp.]MDN5867662.1 FxLYD domain-containing protein [Candidatus Nitrosocosmicus sp.]
MFKNTSEGIRILLIFSSIVITGFLCLNSIDKFDYASAQIMEKITIDLYETQFIPISDTTNNLDVLVNYTTIDPSLSGSRINTVMEVFAPNGTQIKTTSFTDGFSIAESGTIFLNTEFTDDSLSTLTVNVTLTDLEETEIISNTNTATVRYDDEEEQERLKDKFDRAVEKELERQENGDNSDREVERIESTSQSDLSVTSATTYFEGDYFHIVGEVHNAASTEKEFVEVIATLYDEDNNVIGTDNTFTKPSTISSQESAPFEFMIGQSDVSSLDAINSYKIVATDE